MRAKYVLSEVLVGLWRNISMTVAMIITMSVSLTMLGAGLLLYMQVDSMEESYQGKVEMVLFLKKDINDDSKEKQQIEESLKSDPTVDSGSVNFTDKDGAWREFQQMFADAPDLVETVDKDRLPASFGVKLKNMEKDADSFESKYEKVDGVERVLNQRDSLEPVFNLLGGVQKLALIVALVQGVAALLLVANTIQVAAYSKRREVSIMKLVGASNWFVQAPFVLEAVFAGILGSILAFLALVAGKAFLVDGTFKSLFDIMTELSWNRVILMLPILIAISSVISAITGWVTLRFQVKV